MMNCRQVQSRIVCLQAELEGLRGRALDEGWRLADSGEYRAAVKSLVELKQRLGPNDAYRRFGRVRVPGGRRSHNRLGRD